MHGSWQTQIDELRRMIEVSGIARDSLMWKMLVSSLEQVTRAYDNRDFATVERGLKNIQNLLSQCTL